MYTAPFKDGFLFTTSNDSQLFYCNFDEVKTFAGGDERPSRDGTALIGFIKLITPWKRTAEFLDALHSLAKAFFLHEKHAKTTDETIKLAEQYVSVI